MKTKDAKKKLCPFSIALNPGFLGMGIGDVEMKGTGVHLKTRCTTVECMAWIETEKDEGVCGMIPEPKS
ncbi:MAG: hypothetical protein VST70_05050 [Nitrospirota bacterium]|nr:hypothetical protein [Nitrospirota bacterium]